MSTLKWCFECIGALGGTPAMTNMMSPFLVTTSFLSPSKTWVDPAILHGCTLLRAQVRDNYIATESGGIVMGAGFPTTLPLSNNLTITNNTIVGTQYNIINIAGAGQVGCCAGAQGVMGGTREGPHHCLGGADTLGAPEGSCTPIGTWGVADHS